MTRPHGDAAQRRPNGTTAILAGVVGLVLAGVLGYLPASVFIDVGISDLPGKALVMLGLYLGAALLLLLGALVTFFRAVAGAVLLLIGGLAAIGAVLSEPLLLYPSLIGEFFKAMFSFAEDDAFVRVGAAVGGPLVFLLAVLPWTFRYLRYQPYPRGW
ncbi:MAG TPA: hypothetical protein VHC18_01105 [Amycolatopsis sp.]|nr:hypothetical protein [Amycolatopsis sp.]